MNLLRISNKARSFYLRLRNDPDAVVAIRTLFLAICVCLVLVYAGTTILLTPQNEKLAKIMAEKQSLQVSHPGIMDDTLKREYQALENRILGLNESIAESQLKEKLFKLQWETMGDPRFFNQTIMTLNSDAPVKIEQNLKKIDTLEPRSQDNFTIFPIVVEGTASFAELFTYLQYLELRPEVAFIDSLIMSSTDQAREINFSLVAGRMHLSPEETRGGE